MSKNSNADLIKACKSGNIPMVIKLLDEGIDINTKDNYDQTPLIIASDLTNIDLMRVLLNRGANISETMRYGLSALSIAVRNNNVEAVQLLLEFRADCNHQDDRGFSPILFAAKSGNIQMLELLESRGSDLNLITKDGYSALIIAVMSNKIDMIKYLVNRGQKIDFTDLRGFKCLDYAIIGNLEEVFKYFIQKEEDYFRDTNNVISLIKFAESIEKLNFVQIIINSQIARLQETLGDNHLFYAIYFDSKNYIDYLLENKMVDINVSDRNGLTPLMMASKKSNVYLLQKLLNMGADHKAKDNQGYNAFHYACIHGNISSIREILKFRKKVDLDDDFYMSPLFLACFYRSDLKIVDYLLLRGADIEKTDSLGDTVLIKLIKQKNSDINIIDLLLKYDADPNRESESGSPLFFAVVSNRKDIINILIKYDRDIINKNFINGETILNYAIVNLDSDMVEFLIKRGAKISLKNDKNMNALSTAVYHGSIEILKLIIKLVSKGELKNSIKNLLNIAAQRNQIEIAKFLLDEKIVRINSIDENGETAIISAAKAGNLDMVKFLISQNANVSLKDFDKKNALHHAVLSENFELVKLLVENGVSVYEKDKNNYSPIFYSVLTQNVDIIKYFIPIGMEPNEEIEFKKKLYFVAIELGSIELVKYAISRGGINSIKNKNGLTIIQLAIIKKDIELIKYLTSIGAEVTLPNNNISCIDLAVDTQDIEIVNLILNNYKLDTKIYMDLIRHNFFKAIIIGNKKLVEFLIDKGQDPNLVFQNIHTLIYAAKYGKEEIMDLLIERGADINAKSYPQNYSVAKVADFYGFIDITKNFLKRIFDANKKEGEEFSIAIEASKHSCISTLQYLISIDRIDLNLANNKGETPLIIAIKNKDFFLVNFLMGKGADINAGDGNGKTALHLAAENGCLKITNLFIKKVSNIDAEDRDGKTAIHLAAENGHSDIVDSLIGHAAYLEITDRDGKTALHLAAENGHYKIAHRLIAHAVYFEPSDQNGKTPLHLAAENGYLDIATLLIEYGVDINVADKGGNTAFHLAAKNGHFNILHLLIEHGANPIIKNNYAHTPGSYCSTFPPIIEEKFKALDEIYPKVKAIFEKLFTNVSFSIEDSALLGSLENPKNILAKSAFKALVESKIKDFIKDNKIEEIKKLKDFLVANKIFIDVEKLYSDKKEIQQSTGAGAGAGATKPTAEQIEKLKIFKARELGLQIIQTINNATLSERAKLAEINELIDQGADVNPTAVSITALHYAAEKGFLEIATLLIKHGANVDAMQARGYTPLHLAASEGHEKIIDLLIENGADVDAVQARGSTPLHLVALELGYSEDDEKIIDLLIKHGADPTIKNTKGRTAGDLIKNEAIKAKFKALEQIYPKIKAIFEKLFTNVGFSTEDSALFDSLKNPENILAKTAFKACVKTNIKDFIKADKTDEMKQLVQFLKAHEDLIDGEKLYSDEEDIQGATGAGTSGGFGAGAGAGAGGASEPNAEEVEKQKIIKARELGLQIIQTINNTNLSEEDQLSEINKLIDQGANVNFTGVSLNTALHFSAQNGFLEIATLLIKHGANVDAMQARGFTPLHYASQNGFLEIATLLIKHGANVDAVQARGFTPLHLAASEGYEKITYLLIENGADLTIKNTRGETAGDLIEDEAIREKFKALERVYTNIKKILEKLFTDVGFSTEDSALFDSLKNPENILAKKAFKACVKRNIKDFIKAGKTGEMKQLVRFLKTHEDLIDGEKLYFDEKDIQGSTGAGTFTGSGEGAGAGAGGASASEHIADQMEKQKMLKAKELGLQIIQIIKNTNLSEEAQLSEIKKLIDQGADVNVTGVLLKTPIHFAAQNGFLEIATLLIKHGSNLDAVTKNGSTALAESIKYGEDLEITYLLIENGADPTIKNTRGETAGDLIEDEAIKEKFKVLERVYPNIKEILEKLFTISHFSAEDSTVLEILKNPENILAKKAFKGCIKSNIRDFIKAGKTGEMKKLVHFLKIHEGLIDIDEISSDLIDIQQYISPETTEVEEGLGNTFDEHADVATMLGHTE